MENNERLSTIVFVDYESWIFGLKNKYDQEPDIDSWFKGVKSKGNINSIYFFADLSQEIIKKDIIKIRRVSNNIIDCSNPRTKKDYTDFIILDRIYQTFFYNQDIQQFILFSGDGHFSSVVTFLKNYRDKTVGIYAVKGSLNENLRLCASWYEEIGPADEDIKVTDLLLSSIHWAESSGIKPTFLKTVENTAHKHNVNEAIVKKNLMELISRGYISQPIETLDNGSQIKTLKTDWDKLREDSLWA